MARELGHEPDFAAVKRALIHHAAQVFDRVLQDAPHSLA
jgi:hypothetical protein